MRHEDGVWQLTVGPVDAGAYRYHFSIDDVDTVDPRNPQATQTTVALFKRHGFSPVFVESTGGHTWLNWRNYLADFAPHLFRADTK